MLTKLPIELILAIFCYLDLCSLGKIIRLNRFFNLIVQTYSEKLRDSIAQDYSASVKAFGKNKYPENFCELKNIIHKANKISMILKILQEWSISGFHEQTWKEGCRTLWILSEEKGLSRKAKALNRLMDCQIAQLYITITTFSHFFAKVIHSLNSLTKREQHRMAVYCEYLLISRGPQGISEGLQHPREWLQSLCLRTNGIEWYNVYDWGNLFGPIQEKNPSRWEKINNLAYDGFGQIINGRSISPYD